MNPVLLTAPPAPLLMLVALVAIVGLGRAAFAAAGEAPPKSDVVANLDALRAEITKAFDDGKATSKATDERLAALERAVAASARTPQPDGAPDEQGPKARVSAVMRGMLLQREGSPNAWKGSDVERAALSAADDAAGGALIAPETDPLTLGLLRPNLVLGALGVNMISPRTWPYRLPEITSGASGGWVEGATAPSESAQATALKQMTPRKYGMLVKIDRSLLLSADPSVEAIVRQDLSDKAAEVMDLAGFTGTGAAGQPRGMLTYTEYQVGGSQVVAIGATGGDPTFKFVAKLIGKLEDDNALKGRLGFVSHPKTRRVLKNERIAQYSGDAAGGVYIPGSPIMSDAQFEAAIGYPWKVTTQLPITDVKSSSTDCSPIVFGNWQDAYLAKWGGLEIRLLMERGAELDQVWAVAFFRMDFLVRRIKSFAAIRDARVNNA